MGTFVTDIRWFEKLAAFLCFKGRTKTSASFAATLGTYRRAGCITTNTFYLAAVKMDAFRFASAVFVIVMRDKEEMPSYFSGNRRRAFS